MKLSIIIPVYNEADRLAACLDSIAAQTVPVHEVIVVDNNSSDNSAEVARSYDFVRVVNEPRQGVLYARDTGFSAAAGDIIGRIDADTVLPPNWASHIIDFYSQEHNLKTAFTGGGHFYNVRLPRATRWLYGVLAFDLNRLLIGHPTLWGSNMAITRRQWQAVSGETCRRDGIHEDLDLAIHLHEQGFGVHYDRHFRVGTQLRRVRSNRHELWDYLQWWPRTLRLHGKRTWVICWLFGALMLYCITPILNLAEYAARLFGRSPLKDTASAG